MRSSPWPSLLLLRLPATSEGYSTAYYERMLERYLDTGKVVLSVDHAQQAGNVAEAYRRAAANGYLPDATLRSLSRLMETPPPAYPN